MSTAQQIVQQALDHHMQAVTGCMELHAGTIITVASALADSLKNGGKVLSCGNGGSSCDAMHFAGELVGRFVKDREALPAIALTADTGIITAVGNDYGFEHIFSRQVEALGNKGDMLIAISTSGASTNVLRAIEVANEKGLVTVLLTGEKGKDNREAHHVIWVPGEITAHIQETHIMLLQLLVNLTEKALFDM